MTLRFYNGEYRFVLVDTEVHGCTDVVRHMRWRCPSLSSVNIITIIYLAILCFFVVTPKAVIAQDTVAPLVSGNVTIDTTEMVTLYTYVTSTITEDVCQCNQSDFKSVCELPDPCEVQLNGTCSWRTDYVNHCRSHNLEKCKSCMEEFEDFTDKIDEYYSAYANVIERYDCNTKNSHPNNYSVWTCDDCRLAYKDWLCATQIPYKIWGEHGEEEEIEPCEKFCERTEARCPYFLPQKPYCGQRTFFCKGPRQNRKSPNVTDRCFTCNFTLEKDTAKSVEDLGCSAYLVNSNQTSAASHTRGSVHSVLVALTLYILVSWTLSPTVVAGT